MGVSFFFFLIFFLFAFTLLNLSCVNRQLRPCGGKRTIHHTTALNNTSLIKAWSFFPFHFFLSAGLIMKKKHDPKEGNVK